MKYNRTGHAVFYYVRYHLVMSTKYRRRIFKGGMEEYIKLKIREVQRYCPEIVIHEVNTDQDHVHILLSIAPRLAIARAVSLIKANTARDMREQFPFLDKVYWGTRSIWSIGYFISTVGVTEETIKRYIEHQGQEDSGQAKLEL
ncbi:MAG: IS200/IS605 family transposase [Candidatus Micrarchaeaceae archaeon]